MTELEKLDAGLEYDFWDAGVNGRKLRAIRLCGELNAMPMDDESAWEPLIRELLGSAGDDPSIGTGFNCDYGLNIHVGKNFLTNYNVTILDIAPVHIGDYVMIGPNTMICTVGHPMSPMGRRKLDAIKNCEKASFCVIQQDQVVPEEYTTYFRSAIAFGRIQILDGEEAWAAMEKLAARFTPDDTPQGRHAAIEKSINACCVLEFTIEHLTGKESIELVRGRSNKA